MMSSGCLLLGEEDLGLLIDDLDYFFFRKKFIIYLKKQVQSDSRVLYFTNIN